VDTPEPVVPTLFTWAGGATALRRFVEAFYDRVEHDELLSPFFPGGVSTHHREHVAAWWGEVLGGPTTYTDEHGGYAAMLAHHRGLGITAEQRLRFTTTLSRALDDAGLPADPEFRAAVMGYVEWGTRLAQHNSQPDAHDVVADAPVPRWGWGVAPPWQG
jgi:hemoglobin